MKKFTILKSAVAMAAISFCSFTSQAVENYIVEDMVLDHTYSIGEEYMFGQFEGKFTPAQDMTLRVEFNQSTRCCEVWSDAEHQVPYPGDEYLPGSDFFEVDVKAGVPVYLYNSFIMFSFDVTLRNADNTVVSLRDVSVSNGSYLSISKNSFIDFYFSSRVNAGSATIESGEKSVPLSVTSIDGGIVVRVSIANAIMGWYKSKSLEQGDPIKITLKNVMSTGGQPVGDEEGTIVANYLAMNEPITLVSTEHLPVNGEIPFLSYYLPDNPMAIAKMHFSGPLMPLGSKGQSLSAYLQMGDVSYADRSYIGMLQPTLEDDDTTLVFNFSGVRRSYDDIGVPADDENAGIMDLLVWSVMGADGQFAYAGSDSSVGSFGYRFRFEEVSSNVTVDFTPARGRTVNAGEAMEIYIVGLENIDFSGIEFAYGDNKYLVEKKDLTIVVDPEDDGANLIQFNMPELAGVTEGDEITMTFADLLCADGYDHSSQLTCTYVAGEFSGVETIAAEGENVVYSIDGRRVAGNLEKGLYIINGKKVIVK